MPTCVKEGEAWCQASDERDEAVGLRGWRGVVLRVLLRLGEVLGHAEAVLVRESLDERAELGLDLSQIKMIGKEGLARREDIPVGIHQ